MVHRENCLIRGYCAPSLGVYCPLCRDYVVASSLWVSGPVQEVPHCTIDPLNDAIAYTVFKTLGEEYSVTECSVPEEWSSQLHHYESLKTQITKRQDVSTDYINPYPTAFPYGNGMVLHFYQQQESSMTKTVHKVINKGLKTYV